MWSTIFKIVVKLTEELRKFLRDVIYETYILLKPPFFSKIQLIASTVSVVLSIICIALYIMYPEIFSSQFEKARTIVRSLLSGRETYVTLFFGILAGAAVAYNFLKKSMQETLEKDIAIAHKSIVILLETARKSMFSKRKPRSVTEHYIESKRKSLIKSLIIMVNAGIFTLLAPHLIKAGEVLNRVQYYSSVAALISIFITSIIIIVHYAIVAYRVKNGLFGYNSSEAGSLAEFIIKSEETKGDDGSGWDRIYQPEKEVRSSVVYDGISEPATLIHGATQ